MPTRIASREVLRGLKGQKVDLALGHAWKPDSVIVSMQSSKQPDEQEDSRLLRYLPGTLSWLDEGRKTGQKVRLFGL